MVRYFSVAGLALLVLTAHARAGQVSLANGDTLNGRIVEQDGDQLVLEHATLGKLVLQPDQVASVTREGDPQAANAAKQAASTDETKPRQRDDRKKRDSDKPAVTADDSSEERPWETTLLPDWKKSLSLGFSGSAGESTNYSLNAQVRLNKKNEQERIKWDNKYFFAANGGDTSQNEFSSQLNVDWLKPSSNWFYFMQAGYEFDDFEPWRHRVSLYGGPGYTFVDESELEVVGRVGGGANYEFGSVNETTPEGLVSTETIRWHITENQNVSGSVTYFPTFESLDEYRLTANAEWQVKIDRARGLSLKFGVENEYESIKQGDTEKNDVKYYGALGYEF